ncbi:uncharacterized protein LOC143462102 [Clavelina lepadiformis]|uniref:uncharacterized protein LOC143462102 n=1 Tax=Clavelina lepadiformis TaxID=159417 RepID=UPI004042416E
MTFYRPFYGTPEDAAYLQRIALANPADVMDLARLTRSRDTDLTSSLMRYTQPRGVGMYQELNPVYAEQCTTTLTPQSSFESEDGYVQPGINTQAYRPYTYGATVETSIPPHLYDSTISSPGGYGSQGDLRQIGGSQPILGMSGYGENQLNSHHDLPAIINRPDLQWITTSNTDLRTQSPNNSSSPRINPPPAYNNHTSPPNRTVHPQSSLEDAASSTAIITHHHLSAHGFSSASANPPPLQRVRKKTPIGTIPPKPKGTPGRKRKFQDHELSPAEAAKRHVRRERNKVAAAKCRNRRRELTDRLQGETDHLEDCQNLLHQEIMTLQQEKEHLEFILAAHNPNCKAGISANESSLVVGGDRMMPSGGMVGAGMSDVTLVAPPEVMGDIKCSDRQNMRMMENNRQRQENVYFPTPVGASASSADNQVSSGANVMQYSSNNNGSSMAVGVPADLSSQRVDPYPNNPMTTNNNLPNITLSLDVVDAPLNTPVCTLATPSHSTGVFTFPNTPGTSNRDSNFSFQTNTVNSDFNSTMKVPTTPSYVGSVTSFPAPLTRAPQQMSSQTCSAAHRRSSSSDSYHSPDSVKSPANLLAL